MQKITPFLWFNNNVEEAVNFYTATFKDSKVVSMNRSGDALPGEKGKVFMATFQIAGKEFFALNGGPQFTFTPAVSFYVSCETAEETDRLWEKLSKGGKALMPLNKYPFSEKYGWIQDKFGISWQLNYTRTKQHITPLIMFYNEQGGKAGAAIDFYGTLFKNSETIVKAYYNAGEGGVEGWLKHASFSLDGNEFMAMDSSMQHAFPFTIAISFFVNCTTQEEVDFLWERLSEGGRKDRCGWLTDKYGVTWQIIPDILGKLMYDKDPVKSKRVMDAMMKMTKIEIKGLQEAYDQK